MKLELTVPALLFPAISLLYLSYNGRFLALASLIRKLHEQWREQGGDQVLGQIKNLRERLELIRRMQLSGAASFFMAGVSMLLLFVGFERGGSAAFALSLALLLASVAFLLRENTMSVRALHLQLDTFPADVKDQ